MTQMKVWKMTKLKGKCNMLKRVKNDPSEIL